MVAVKIRGAIVRNFAFFRESGNFSQAGARRLQNTGTEGFRFAPLFTVSGFWYCAPPMISPANACKALLFFCCLFGMHSDVLAHGSVTAAKDMCIIKIGFYSAHFKIYLPRTRGHKQYCEDLPDTGETVFVMEYTYGDLGGVPVDFRIIRDVTGVGLYAKPKDVEALSPEELDSATVFYRPPAKQPDVYTVNYRFEESGYYLGIVTARHPETNQLYTAVFPFEVGYTGYGYVPYIFLFALLIQGIYWWMNRDKRELSEEEEQ